MWVSKPTPPRPSSRIPAPPQVHPDTVAGTASSTDASDERDAYYYDTTDLCVILNDVYQARGWLAAHTSRPDPPARPRPGAPSPCHAPLHLHTRLVHARALSLLRIHSSRTARPHNPHQNRR